MEYKKTDLRNNNMNLLRRIQRQNDCKQAGRILKPTEMNEDFKVMDDDFSIMTVVESPVKTRIGLYDRRGKR